MDPAKVFEVRPVAEPSAHLEKRVVHPRVSVHVANGQPVERKTARETEAADSDGREAGAFFLVFLVVEPLVTLAVHRSEEHTSELQSLMRISYAVFCLKKKTKNTNQNQHHIQQKLI